MKLRAITIFLAPSSTSELLSLLDGAASFLLAAKAKYSAAGWEVQTLRCATTSFEKWLDCSSTEAGLKELQEIDAAASAHAGVDFLSVGPAVNHYDIVAATLTASGTDKIFFNLPVGMTEDEVPDLEKAKAAAEVVVKVAATSPAKVKDVPSCFRMTITGNVGPGTPFFPGGYSDGSSPYFAIACENSDLLVQAFTHPDAKGNLGAAKKRLNQILTENLCKVEAIARDISREWNDNVMAQMHMGAQLLGSVAYGGVDASIASAAGSGASLVRAYEALGLGPFGGAGTLAISSIITGVIKKLPVKMCGYSGLMLPLTEDLGLAQRGSEGTVSIQTLLHYSAVCGCGIDTVPVSGATSADELAVVFCDMVAMAFRLKKPLSARLWPVKGLQTGDMTQVDNPFFVNCKCMQVAPTGVKPLPSPESSSDAEDEWTLLDLPASSTQSNPAYRPPPPYPADDHQFQKSPFPGQCSLN